MMRMIVVEIYGRLKNKQKVIDISEEILNDYLPLTRKIKYVDVWFTRKCDDECAGLCMGDKDEVDIELARTSYDYKYNYTELLQCLCHELVHAKQFLSGELSGKRFKWNKQDYSEVAYKKLPWEMEAYGTEKWLFKTYFKKELGI
tara:strand:+ start:2207 stop:2641 length:435 start_codon:yes stop_codon:yes gene_type:complete